jgi:hypothetical protein
MRKMKTGAAAAMTPIAWIVRTSHAGLGSRGSQRSAKWAITGDRLAIRSCQHAPGRIDSVEK